jgi:putative membrane protein
MPAQLPYCGTPPVPGELAMRFNLDPILIVALLTLAVWHLHRLAHDSRELRAYAAVGWSVAAAAFISPLCALSVALFSARVGQHMILVLVAAPLIARAWPKVTRAPRRRWRLWAAAGAFFIALWFWHMPTPYDATFASTPIYWSMHITLFGSAILLWRELLHHAAGQTAEILAVSSLTSMHMGLLGAILTFAGHPLFFWHLLSMTSRWGLTPLQDQQLGGVFMWVPGIALFLWVAIRSCGRLWNALEGVKTT